jgi:hypothetical protein
MAYKIFAADDVAAATVAAGDSFLIIDANASNATRKGTIAALATAMAGNGIAASSGVLSVDNSELTAAAVDVANDLFMLIDANDSSASKKESFADLATAMAGTGLSAASGAFSVDASQSQITTLAGLTAAGAAAANLTLTYASAKLQSSSASEPTLTIENTNADGNAGTLKFNKNGSSVADNDIAGSIFWSSEDDGSNAQNYAAVHGGVVDMTDGSEQGFLSFYIAENDGALTSGLELKGLASDGDITVDVKTHDGAAGGLMLGGTLVTSTAAEMNLLDTASAGSVVNSKAVVYGSGGELAGTLSTAAQASVTSLGTLTALTVDDVAVDGKVITMTGSSGDTATMTVGTDGTLAITTLDAAAAAANMTLTADGTFEAVGTTITLDSGGAINLEPAAGSAILLDGTISVDEGVVTGATSVTSTAFVGALTGDVTGNASGTAATVTTAAQTNITSLGTLTALQVDYINANASTLTITDSADTGDTFSIVTTTHGATTIATVDDDAAAAHLSLDVDGNITLDADAGTITFADGGSSLGTITSAGWTGAVVGNVTGNASGTAATVTTAAQPAITSLGTLTTLAVDNITINGNDISSTAGTDLTITPLAGQQIVLDSTIVVDAGVVTGATSITSSAFVGDITGDVTGTADLATSFTVSANNSTDETVYPLFVDGATGSQGAETDTGLSYNPSSGNLTLGGALTAASLDISGNVDVDGTMEADAYTVDGDTLAEYIADTVGAMVGSNTESGISVAYQDGDNTLDFTVATLNQDTTGTAAIATTITVADESSDTTCFPMFSTAATGDLAPKSGSNLTFNSSTGALFSTAVGGYAFSAIGVVAKTANYTGDAGGTPDAVVLCDSATGTTAFTVTMPSAVIGRRLTVKDSGGGAASYNITVATPASETIDGAASFVLNINYGAVTLTSDGTNWFIV